MSAAAPATVDGATAGTSGAAKFALDVGAKAAVDAPTTTLGERIARQGIPKADVVENVEEYLKQHKVTIDEAQKSIEDRYRRYKTVEASMSERRTRLVSNLPDFNRALEYITVCRGASEQDRTEIEVLCKVEENSYQRFRVTQLQKVILMLGCNTYAEFGLDEAEKLLTDNVMGIERLLGQLREELDWVRDQVTTCEVSIAHLYNYSIRNKQVKAAA